jgi:hypothetical protein
MVSTMIWPELKPLDPVFDEEKRMGGITVGNTPPGIPPPAVYPAYDTLVLSLSPSRYYPGDSTGAADLAIYNYLVFSLEPTIFVDDYLGSADPLLSYDEKTVDLGPDRYVPGDEVNP